MIAVRYTYGCDVPLLSSSTLAMVYRRHESMRLWGRNPFIGSIGEGPFTIQLSQSGHPICQVAVEAIAGIRGARQEPTGPDPTMTPPAIGSRAPIPVIPAITIEPRGSTPERSASGHSPR